MKKLICGIAFACLVGSASAADLVVKGQAGVITPAQPVNWTGLYLGGTVGYGWKDQNNTIVGNNALSSFLVTNALVPGSVNLRPSGALLGGVMGYDWQFAPRFVAGVAVDYAWANLRDSNTALGNLISRSVDEKITSFGTIRGRLGYLITDRAMIYATGGGAWANIRTNVTSAGLVCFPGLVTCGTGSSSDTKWGWVVGGGLEYRLDRNWSLGAEALWADLGTQTTQITGATAFGCKGPCPLSYTQSQDNKIGIVRAALTYRF